MASSLWGSIQGSKSILRGFRIVGTASHGGAMLTEKFAKENLTPNAIKRGVRYGNYLCYEEDCDINIVFFELYNLIQSTQSLKLPPKEVLIRSLSAYHPDYLIEKGITPTEKEYKGYLMSKESERLKKEKNPNLIVSASRLDGAKTKVVTADGKEYIVEGYGELFTRYLNKECLLLLQYCRKVTKVA